MESYLNIRVTYAMYLFIPLEVQKKMDLLLDMPPLPNCDNQG